MRVIFDENIPAPLRVSLAGHEVTTVQERGWSGIANGELIRRVDGIFDVLLLADKNLRYQQNLVARRIALVELPTNRWPFLQAIIPQIVEAVNLAKPGSYTVIELRPPFPGV